MATANKTCLKHIVLFKVSPLALSCPFLRLHAAAVSLFLVALAPKRLSVVASRRSCGLRRSLLQYECSLCCSPSRS